MVVGRVCPQRAAGRDRAQPGALDNIGENLVFLRRFSGDTEQIAQTDDKGGRVSRSVCSAWSLLPLSDVWRGSKAGVSSTRTPYASRGLVPVMPAWGQTRPTRCY